MTGSRRVRLVVTGHAPDGRSVVISDGLVDPVTVSLMPGAEFHRIWGADETVRLPTDGGVPAAPGYFPPPGGFRLTFHTFAPAGSSPPADLDRDRAMAELGEKLPGVVEVREPDAPGMHTSDTVDVGVVLSGEVWLELDDGAEVRLAAGDCYVQNGTRHAWHNRAPQPCVMAIAIVGARRRPG
jgi:Cupin domain